jgi:hypothetical protein
MIGRDGRAAPSARRRAQRQATPGGLDISKIYVRVVRSAPGCADGRGRRSATAPTLFWWGTGALRRPRRRAQASGNAGWGILKIYVASRSFRPRCADGRGRRSATAPTKEKIAAKV